MNPLDWIIWIASALLWGLVALGRWADRWDRYREPGWSVRVTKYRADGSTYSYLQRIRIEE